MRLYHYTNIETLALILKNKTIRFNRLDQVNDLEEGRSECSGVKIGQYIFVSCWTEDQEESIPLWRLYTEKGVGVRIGIDKEMFKTYSYNDGDVVNGVLMKGNAKTLLSADMLKMSDIFIVPIFNDNVFYRSVKYVDDIKKALENAVVKNAKGGYNFNLTQWGAYKNKRWGFENESRFVLNIYPNTHHISSLKPEFASWICHVLDRGIPNSINYYDMDLDDNAMETMDITLCPNMSYGNKLIVESLCKTYLGNVVPHESSLTNLIKLK